MKRLQKIWRLPAAPILTLVILNLLVGLLVFRNYGESWDENGFYIYGQDTLNAYQTVFSTESMRPSLLGPIFNYRYYGPFYMAFSALFAGFGHGLFPEISTTDFWHLSYFLSFQLALVALYFICLRWVSRPAAIGATLLFNTQPLLWGHAFINPKDVPFTAFFLASIWSGLWMVDRVNRLPKLAKQPPIGGYWQTATDLVHGRVKKVGLGAALLAAMVVWLPLNEWVAAWAYSAEASPDGWSHDLLQRLTPNLGSIPLDTYLVKFAQQIPWLKATGVVVFAALFIVFVLTQLPDLRKHLLEQGRQLRAHWLPVCVAGFVLGLTGAIRVVAPAAGGIVIIYVIYHLRFRSILPVVIYLGVAAVVTYALWPFLWGAPISGFVASLNEMSNFPKDIEVLFNGAALRSIDLPASYLPVLISIQITLPALVLALVGGILGAWRDLREKPLLWLMAAWFLLPVVGVMALRPTLYDNFRQLVFILPPLFIFGAIALEALWKRVGSVAYTTALFVLALPGLVALMQLHPYEYVYYNHLVGGVAGAEDRFEMDYWATSYREAILYINQVAAEGAGVYVHGPDHMLRHFGRPDLVAVYEVNSQQSDLGMYDYAVLTTRFNTDETLFPEGKVVYTVCREGVVFSVVKQIKRGQ